MFGDTLKKERLLRCVDGRGWSLSLPRQCIGEPRRGQEGVTRGQEGAIEGQETVTKSKGQEGATGLASSHMGPEGVRLGQAIADLCYGLLFALGVADLVSEIKQVCLPASRGR